MSEKEIEAAFEVFRVERDVFHQFDPRLLCPGQYIATYFKVCKN